MNDTSILIIDGNNWFRRRAETDAIGNPLRRCYNEIQNSPYDIVILVWDGYSSLKARRAIFPDYKAQRKPAGESIYEYQKTFKHLALLSKAITIEVEGYEGDDVIAALVRHYQKDKAINNIRIESNDADLSQLGVPMAREQFPIEPKWIPLYKTLVGDPSDNIKGIPGFGKQAWEALTELDKEMYQACVTGKSDRYTTVALSKRVINWLEDINNWNQLKIYWQVVNFIPIDFDLIVDKMKAGTNARDAAETILTKYMA